MNLSAARLCMLVQNCQLHLKTLGFCLKVKVVTRVHTAERLLRFTQVEELKKKKEGLGWVGVRAWTGEVQSLTRQFMNPVH